MTTSPTTAASRAPSPPPGSAAEAIAAARGLMAGRVALVTGAGSGIGAATARALGHAGAAVVVNYRSDAAAAEQVVAGITDDGGRALAVRADVTDADQVAALVDRAEQQLGPVDTAVLSAIGGSTRAPGIAARFTDITVDDYLAVVSRALAAAVVPVKAVLPGMRARRSGCVVFISSIEARRPVPQFVALASAKAAIDSLARNLAADHGPDGIRFNSVAPALVETPANTEMPEELKQVEHAMAMTPLRRVAHPDDIAAAVLAVASPLAGFVTGTFLPVDGGWSMP